MRAHSVEAVVVEATSHALALHRLEGLSFAAAAFTNLSRDHLDFHGTVEAYFEAKRSLFAPEHVASAAVNVDDAWGRRLLASASVPCTGFGCSPDAAVRAVDIRLGEAGTRFRLVVADEGETAVSTALAGEFNVSNCLAAAALALQAGASLDAVGAGLPAAPALPGRLEQVDAGQPFAVLIDYAHGPGSLEAALVEARRRADGRRVVCVFGCGGGADPGKRPLMGAVAARLADRVIVTTDNPRGEDPEEIAAEIRAGARGAVETVLDRAEAIARALESARPGDVVLVAGKGHERTQQVAGATVPFDDREVALRALAEAGR
jgi:UDP-N-acetylmuramoyl-L-alanyl-D-glutamate--2,6-diaminopimelate ligase